jgi:hypothetical protein
VDGRVGQLLVAVLGVGVGAVQAAARRSAERSTRSATTSATRASAAQVAGMAHWNPEGLPTAWSRASPRSRSCGAEPRPAGCRGPRRVVRGARLHRRRLRGRGRRRNGAVDA